VLRHFAKAMLVAFLYVGHSGCKRSVLCGAARSRHAVMVCRRCEKAWWTYRSLRPACGSNVVAMSCRIARMADGTMEHSAVLVVTVVTLAVCSMRVSSLRCKKRPLFFVSCSRCFYGFVRRFPRHRVRPTPEPQGKNHNNGPLRSLRGCRAGSWRELWRPLWCAWPSGMRCQWCWLAGDLGCDWW